MLGLGSLLLIGIDQPRPPALLEAAYNDRAGISAAFALNLLTRLQRELGAELDPSGFSYRARWQEQEQRIEMALVSQGQQRLRLLGLELEFAPGEALITEYSYKFSPQAFIQLAAAAGWTPQGRWCDPADQFSLHLLQAGVPTANC